MEAVVIKSMKHQKYGSDVRTGSFFETVESPTVKLPPPTQYGTSAIPNKEGKVVWHYSTKGGFTRFGCDAQPQIENHYQEFMKGSGSEEITVVSDGRNVNVNFRNMKQKAG